MPLKADAYMAIIFHRQYYSSSLYRLILYSYRLPAVNALLICHSDGIFTDLYTC